MRCVFVGIEYAGKSTLITLLGDYYRQRRLPVHGDDHFTLTGRVFESRITGVDGQFS